MKLRLKMWVLGLVVLLGPVAVVQAQDAPVVADAAVVAVPYAGLMSATVFLLRQGNWPGAIGTGKAAFDAARNDNERVNAARLVASAHFRAGQFVRAEWWLRRALNNAVEGAGAQAVRQDFALVRQANPLSMRLSFAAAPNSNVNNGSSSQTLTLFNLPFVLSADARALSGYEVSGSVDLRYRLAQSEDFITHVGVLLHGRTFELTGSAAAAAPGVKGSDFAFSGAELSLAHRRKFEGMPGPTDFGLSLGRNWFGGDPYTGYGRLSLGQVVPLSETTGLNLSLSQERQVAQHNNDIISDITTLASSINHRLGNRDVVGISVRLQGTQSDDMSSESAAVRLGASYGIARPIWGMKLSLNMAVEQRDFDFSIYDADGRHDLTLSAGATVTLITASYFGFSPTMSLEANRTSSNVDLFDRKTVAVRFGLQSAF